MQLVLCFTLVTLLQFSNGSSLPSGDLEILFTKTFSTNSVPFWANYGTAFEAPCIPRLTDEVITEFRVGIFKFITLAFKKAVVLTEGHFVFSPYTAWLSLAALAEGSEGPTRQELFKILSLPEDRCLREAFYRLGTTREAPSNDVILVRNRLFITDSRVRLNTYWKYLAQSYAHLNTVSIPFKSNVVGVIEVLKQNFKAQLPNFNADGNSFLLESLDYHGLWSSAFSDAVIEPGPFYNNFGEKIGTMEYMRTWKRVNMAYAASANLKIIEMPVGRDGHYKMLIATSLGKDDHARSLGGIHDDLVFESLANLRPTVIPIEIVIPRLTMTSEVDIRQLLEGVGIERLWTDPAATRNISEPPALPSSYIQRVTVTLDTSGVGPPVHEYYNFVPPLRSGVHTENLNFVANKPFLFGIYDSETYVLLFAASFSKPNA